MKLLIIAFAITSIFASCSSKSSEQGKNVVGLDTAGLYKNNVRADTAQAVPAPGTTTKKVVETHSPDGSVTTTTTTTSADKPVTKPKTSTGSTATANPVTATATAQPAAAAATKKGWSSRAKGAAIGGVGGAVAGAVISKKKGKGAIIGGLAGAAGGYIIGNEKDKKKGR